MALLDHFKPPLSRERHWHSFHNAWSTYISSALNQVLPDGYFAETSVQFGIEIDVAAFHVREPGSAEYIAGAHSTWSPGAPVMTIPFTQMTDAVEVLVFASEGGPGLVGAIELVSPGNKDRPEQRAAFLAKCEAYLQRHVGLVIVDIVTTRTANLHGELLERLRGTIEAGSLSPLYASAYRPASDAKNPIIEVWHESLHLAKPLPTLPLWLKGGLCLELTLEESYSRTCTEQRVAPADRV